MYESGTNDFGTAGEGAGKAMTRIYGNIGFSGLWNGLPVRIVMIGTLTAFQWLMYVIPSALLLSRAHSNF